MLHRIAPLAFVFLWSTGWIVARYVVDFADPLLFLVFRFLFAGLILGAFALAVRAAWPRTGQERIHALVSGVLLHTGYLGGVWWAVQHGLSASLSALISAIQPILTAAIAPLLLGERFGAERAIGIALGFCGLFMVMLPRLSAATGADGSAAFPILVNCLSMVSVTAGTLYQKRFIRTGDLRTIAALQYASATVVMIPFAVLIGDLHFHWSLFAALNLAWAVGGLSIGAIALLLFLIRQGEISRASQLLFLVPPVAALQAMILFGDRLAPVQWAGMAMTAAGVALSMRRA